jgi:nucleoside-diphosphate-sugar epimerase
VVPAAGVPDEKRLPYDFSHPIVVDTTRIREQLGYEEVVRADDALRRTVEWERNGAEPAT